MKKILTIFLVMMLVMVGMASAATLNVNSDYFNERNVIVAAADRIVETQNNDGGWEWGTPDTDPSTGVPSPINTIGVTTQGLLDAYRLTGEEAYLDSTVDAYNYMVVLASSDERMRGPDIPFLVELSEVTGDLTYANLARTRYEDILSDYGNATSWAKYIRDARVGQGWQTLVSWDINLYVQGALALDRYYSGQGFDDDADAMTEVIYNYFYVDEPGFDLENDTQSAFWLAHTGAIEAFTTTGLHLSERDSLRTDLLTSQQGDGSFSDMQTTAYAVMALLKVGEDNSAAENAISYLINSQEANGGWIETDSEEYTEVDSEAAQALFDFIYVPDTYYMIQDAIDAASDGDTINVYAGTYEESILIDEELTLIGDGEVIMSGDESSNYLVKITADDVVFDNFEVNGQGSARGDNAFDYGIWLTDTDNVEIKNSDVKNVWATSANGIQVDDSTNSDIHDNTISSFDKRGIRYVNSDGIFYDNEVIGDNVDGTERVQNLVNLWGGSSVEIYKNKLHNALTTPGITPTWDSPGIFVSSYGGNGNSYADIHDNEIYNCDSGIVVGSVYSTIDNSTADITNNYLHNLGWAINFEKETVSATIHHNHFSNVNKAVNAEVSTGPLSNPPVVNAENNYWGTNIESEIQTLVYGDVDYDPWSQGNTDDNVDTSAGIPTQVETNVEETDAEMTITTSQDQTDAIVNVVRYNENPGAEDVANFNIADLGIYLDVSTNIPNEGISEVTLKIYYDESNLGDIPENQLKPYWYNPDTEEWEAIDDYMVNTVNNYVEFTVDHLSLFTVGSEGNVGGTGGDFIALSVPDFIDYGTLYGIPGYETQEVSVVLENTGSLDITVTPKWDSGHDVFKYIKFSDVLEGTFNMIQDGVGTESVYSTDVTANLASSDPLEFSNFKTVYSKIKITDDLRPLKGALSGTIYFQATEA